MLPENRLSITTLKAPFLAPDGMRTSVTKDREYGGIALNDPTKGMFVQIWDFKAVGNKVILESPTFLSDVLFEHTSNIQSISCTFDQNMNPCVAFVDVFDIPWLYWFDTAQGLQVFSRIDTDFLAGEGVVTPTVALDDKRATQTGTSDIILAYVQNKVLKMRIQRDRFQTEYILAYRVNAKILDMGMNSKSRMQFKLKYNGLTKEELGPPIYP